MKQIFRCQSVSCSDVYQRQQLAIKFIRRVACENNYMSRVTIVYSRMCIDFQFNRFCLSVQVEGGWAPAIFYFSATHHQPQHHLESHRGRHQPTFSCVSTGRKTTSLATRHARSQEFIRRVACENNTYVFLHCQCHPRGNF